MGEHRSERLASVMLSELGNLIMREIDIPPGVLLTISAIDISSDSRNAKVWVSVFPEERTADLVKALNESAGNLHYKLIRIMNIRTVPTLQFLHDTGSDNAAAVEKVFIEPLPAKKKVDKKA